MPRGLDHIVHAVRDLDMQADFYRRAGFTVGAQNRHPWGTHNHVVQFPGFFVELLNIGQPELIVPHASRFFSFGDFLRGFLARDEGLAMLVLEGRGAAADADAFRLAGIGDFQVFDFEREAKRPNGSTVKVAFSLVFATDEQASNAGFFTCQQRYPENFWNPEFQNHPNGVTGVAGVTMVAEQPEQHRHFLSAFAGVSEVRSELSGISAVTPRGDIQIMTPAAYRTLFGVKEPDLAHGGRLAALRFAVRDRAKLLSVLAKGGIAGTERNGNVVVPPDEAFGATLIFEQN